MEFVANWLADYSPIVQATFGGLFTWAITALGASVVFFTRRVGQKLMDAMLGFSGGIMLAASYWSLLAPAIEIGEASPLPAWFPASIGFITGAFAIWGLDRLLPHLHLGFADAEAEGPKTNWHRSLLLILAITLHNVPEGLAVGVAFGGTVHGESSATLRDAITLALGIGIQNCPEGIAVAAPLRAEGVSRWKSWTMGQASAIVEPIAAVIGAGLVSIAAPILPYALAFAAGAMVFVVVEELIPETSRAGNLDLATLFLVVGFSVMMILDVALG